MSIENYVTVAISILSPTVTQAGFGIPMFAGVTPGWLTGSAGDLIRFYNNLIAVGLDFANTNPEYLAAQTAFSQVPQPPQIAIGKVPAPVQGVMTVTFSGALIAANVVNAVVNGQPIAPVTFATTNAATLTALAAAFALMPGIASATSDGTAVLTVTGNFGTAPTITGVLVTLGVTQVTATVATTTPAVLYSTGLAAIRTINQTWYGLAIGDRTAGNLLDVAAWSEAQLLKFGAQTSDAAVLTTATTDVMSLLQAKTYSNTFSFYHAINAEHLAFGLMAGQLTNLPGSSTWMFKQVPGVTVDAITDTQRLNVQAKNGNIYTAQAGVNMTDNGKVASGQYIDIIVGRDWLQATLKTDIFGLMTTAAKIPYTDKGAAQLESIVRARLKVAIDNGVLSESPPFVIVVPKVANQLTADRANRYFPGLSFSATLAGAIHKVAVTGTVSV
jgi:hypothetical protein